MLTDGTHQAEFVERHRPQSVDQLAHLGDRVAGRPAKLGKQLQGACRIPREEVRGRVRSKRDRRQGRSQPVVQVAPETAALIFKRGDEALPGSLQVSLEADGLDRDRELRAEVLEETQIAGLQRVSSGRPDPELADELALMRE